MPPDSQNEQELMLKKRARRRLVGAIALVLLMIIVLPQVLQDRAVLAQQDPIKIVMHEATGAVATEANTNHQSDTPPDAAVGDRVTESTSPTAIEPAQTFGPEVQTQAVQAVERDKATQSDKASQQEKPTQVAKTDNMAASKPSTSEAAPVAKDMQASQQAALTQPKEMFTVQVGVYSDASNVKRLQEQLKQAGFATKTEKIKTAKGESIRLKAGSYESRQDATQGLAKIKDMGLPGIVVSQ